MWRRYGDGAYAVLLLTVFSAEALGLSVLMWAFFFNQIGFGPQLVGLHLALVFAVALTAVAVLIVTGYTLAFQAWSSARRASHQAAVADWGRKWVAVVFSEANPPRAPWPRAASEALVDLHEELTGAYRENATALLVSSGFIQDLLAEASSGKRRRGRKLAQRLDALDLLARVGAPVGFEALGRLAKDPEDAIRVMAVRALARVTSNLSEEGAQDEAARMLVTVFADSRIPRGAVEEAVLMLGQAAPAVLRALLSDARDTPTLDLAPIALDGIGRLKLVSLLDLVVDHVEDDDPDVRAAALRTFGLIGFVPPEAHAGVLAACGAPEASVRSQAARAVALLPATDAVAALRKLGHDPSWWVRRAAAWALVRVGERGVAVLRRAARESRDPYGREIAIQVLSDAKRITPRRALKLQAAG